MSVDQVPEYMGVGVAAIAAWYGIRTYKNSNRECQAARQKEIVDREKEQLTDIIMPLLERYEKLDAAETAIRILDGNDHEIKDDSDPAYKLYGPLIDVNDLPLLLRDHNWVNTSEEEDKVRDSFDELLFFFAELDYIMSIKLVGEANLELFKYEIRKAATNPAVVNFVRIYKLPLYGRIHPHLTKDQEGIKVIGDEREQLEKLQTAGYKLAKADSQ